MKRAYQTHKLENIMQAFYENPLTDEASFRHAIKEELTNIHKEVKNPSVEDSEFYPPQN